MDPTTDKLKSRITVVEAVYHQSPGADATSVGEPFYRWLQTDEQPCIRKTRVGEEWLPLDTGWVTEASMLVVRNEEGVFLQVQPTEAQRAAVMAKVIELGIVTQIQPPPVQSKNRDMHSSTTTPAQYTEVIVPVLLLLPGESMRGMPIDLGLWRIRCRSGEAKYTASAFPL